MSMFMQTNRRAALSALGGSAALLALTSGATASTGSDPDPGSVGSGALSALARQLAAIPRRRGFATVPFLVTSPEDWDQAAAALVLAYRTKSLQIWEIAILADRG